jgi:hypothetical protein
LVGNQPTEHGPAVATTGSAGRASGASEEPSTPISRGTEPARRPRWPPTPTETRVEHGNRGRGMEPSSIVDSGRPRDAAGLWRARVLAITGLLVALVVLVVLLTSK